MVSLRLADRHPKAALIPTGDDLANAVLHVNGSWPGSFVDQNLNPLSLTTPVAQRARRALGDGRAAVALLEDLVGGLEAGNGSLQREGRVRIAGKAADLRRRGDGGGAGGGGVGGVGTMISSAAVRGASS